MVRREKHIKGAISIKLLIALSVVGMLLLIAFAVGISAMGLRKWGEPTPTTLAASGTIQCSTWSDAPSGYQKSIEAAAASSKAKIQPALLGAIFLSEHGDDWPTWGPEAYKNDFLPKHPGYDQFKQYAPFQFEESTWKSLGYSKVEDMMDFDIASKAAAEYLANILKPAELPVGTTEENHIRCAAAGYNSGGKDCKDWAKSNFDPNKHPNVTNKYDDRAWDHFVELNQGCQTTNGSTGEPPADKPSPKWNREIQSGWLKNKNSIDGNMPVINGVVLHYSATGNKAEAISSINKHNSYSHLLVDTNGKVSVLLPLNTKITNGSGDGGQFAIGINIVGADENALLNDKNKAQFDAVIDVINYLKNTYGISTEVGNKNNLEAKKGIFGHMQVQSSGGSWTGLIKGCKGDDKTKDPGAKYMNKVWDSLKSEGKRCI